VLADAFGMAIAIATVGMVTIGSGILAAVRMPETHAVPSRKS
jgi:hypothetical protein